MKKEKQEKTSTPIDTILSDSYCDGQIYYTDLGKRPEVFSKQVATLTVKSA